jgi:hypothetical protein
MGDGMIIWCGLPSDGQVAGTVQVSAVPQKVAQFVKVQFYVDEKVVLTDDKGPFDWNWDTTTVANGQHRVKARGYTATDSFADTPTVTATVNN